MVHLYSSLSSLSNFTFLTAFRPPQTHRCWGWEAILSISSFFCATLSIQGLSFANFNVVVLLPLHPLSHRRFPAYGSVSVPETLAVRTLGREVGYLEPLTSEACNQEYDLLAHTVMIVNKHVSRGEKLINIADYDWRNEVKREKYIEICFGSQ